MVDRDVFDRRLGKLAEWLKFLRRIAEHDLDTFLVDPGLQAQAERWLHLLVEGALDLGNHLIADRGWPSPTTNRGVFRTLTEQGVLDPPLGQKLEDWAGLRNLLVHVYLEIDHQQIHRILRAELGDIEAFASAVAEAAYGDR